MTIATLKLRSSCNFFKDNLTKYGFTKYNDFDKHVITYD